ncbi:MAG: hypothetical protein ACE5HT_01870 [Gemmatimonadales bacterium]
MKANVLLVPNVFLLLALTACSTLPREARFDTAPREDPRLRRFGDDPYYQGGVTVELDEASYVAVFNVFHDGFVQAYYPYKKWQHNFYPAGTHLLRGGERAQEVPLAIIVSPEPLRLSKLNEHLAQDGGIGHLNANPGNGYQATYDFGRGSVEETIQAIARAIVPNYEGDGWAVFYYCGSC